MVDCTRLSIVYESLRCGTRADCLERMAVLLALYANMPVGRVALSKLLRLRERRVRSIVYEWKDAGIVELDRGSGARIVSNSIAGVLDNVFWDVVRGAGEACIAGVVIGEALYNAIVERYLFLRDVVVVVIGEPGVLEFLGVYAPGVFLLPGLPPSLEKAFSAFIELVKSVVGKRCGPGTDRCVFIVTGRPRCCIYSAAALMLGLMSLCGYTVFPAGRYCEA